MKRNALVCGLALLLCMLFPTAVSAWEQSDAIIGTVYSTDILAYVNGHPAPSYNIGGKTVVLLEDLDNSGYGFNWFVDDEHKTITVTTFYYKDYGAWEIPNVERGTTGRIQGTVMDCMYSVIFNGTPVQGYVIDGKLGVCIEEIGALDGTSSNEAYGYNKMLCNMAWEPTERTISLNTVGGEQWQKLNLPCIYLNAYDNVIQGGFDPMIPYNGPWVNWDHSEEFNDAPFVLHTLYLDTEQGRTEIGLCYMDTRNVVRFCLNDIDQVREILQPLVYADTPCEQVLSLLDDGVNYRILDRLETENHIFVVIELLHGEAESNAMYVAVQKSGGYYALSYTSTQYTTRTLEKIGVDTVRASVYPFAGPHGATTMHQEMALPGLTG